MNISFGNIGTGNAHFGIGEQTHVDHSNGLHSTPNTPTIKHSALQPPDMDPLLGSEPVAEIPVGELSRDDALGRLVSSAFNFPAPPMPEFRG